MPKFKIMLALIALFNVLLFGVTYSAAVEREDCGTRVGTLAAAGDHRPASTSDQMRVYPLHVGDTLVPYEQFYGGTELSGLGGTFQLLNSSRFFWVPLYMFVIDHPQVGPILLDTAVNTEMVYNYDEYFAGNAGVASRMMDEEYQLEPEQAIPEQLARLGYTPEDIELVILTHSHDDHVGGLPYFKHARIVLSQAEFAIVDYITTNPMPVNTKYYEGVTCWEPVSFTDGAVADFSASQDVLGDGSIVLLPTPGHSDGSLAALVRMDDYHLILTGDTVYTMRHLDPDNVLQFIPDTDPMIHAESIQKINALRQQLPGTVVLPSHDHTGYTETLLASMQQCGLLSAENRERIAAYESALFDADGHVMADLLPEYLPAEDGSKYGAVNGVDITLPDTASPTCDA